MAKVQVDFFACDRCGRRHPANPDGGSPLFSLPISVVMPELDALGLDATLRIAWTELCPLCFPRIVSAVDHMLPKGHPLKSTGSGRGLRVAKRRRSRGRHGQASAVVTTTEPPPEETMKQDASSSPEAEVE